MIVVKIELWPCGVESIKREIGRMYVANDGHGSDIKRGSYDALVCKRGSSAIPAPFNPEGPQPTRVGRVENYPRLAYNVWRLILRCLRDAFPEEK